MGSDQLSILNVMFVDVSGGPPNADDGADSRGYVERWVNSIILILCDADGLLIRAIGPTVRCSFSDTDDALRAAVAVQRDLAADASGPALRIGIHVGEVAPHDETYAGYTMKTAAKMAMLAKPGQIICTPEAVEATSAAWQQDLHPVTEFAVAGVRVEGPPPHELRWQKTPANGPRPILKRQKTASDLATLVVPPSNSAPGQSNVLFASRLKEQAKHRRRFQPSAETQPHDKPLDFTPRDDAPVAGSGTRPPPSTEVGPRMQLRTSTGATATVDPDSPRLSVGRGTENALTCQILSASRRHGEIAFRDGQFLFEDHSRYGTFISHNGDSEPVLVHNQTTVLKGTSGAIYPGSYPWDDNTDRIMYWIEGA